MNTSKTRNLYYVMDEKEEMFVKGNLNNHGLTDAQICHLAGNSICVPVLQHIFTKLIAMGEIER